MGSAMRLIHSGTAPNTEQISPEYLKKPISPRSVTVARVSHSFFPTTVSAASICSAQNQSASAINISSRTYFGSPQV